MIKAAALLLVGGGAIGLALFEMFAHFADRTSVLARIRDLTLDGPENPSDMAAATYWLELAVLIPIGVLAILDLPSWEFDKKWREA